MINLKIPALLLFGWLFQHTVIAQNILVEPYLQDATPSSIYIMWETDSGEESLVHWGLTEALGNTASGTAQISNGDARIHTVKLEGLQSATRYYYQAQTGSALSEIHYFKTPPLAIDQESFRLIAMSDMQQDAAFPDKFMEIVQDGIIHYLEEEIGGDITDNLALVMIPGDLVQNGNNYESWRNTFFNPAEELFHHVPVYPVPGNHENNAVYYFQYFHLPENGNPDFEEHWWYKDYGNVRIIGLDSNAPFSNQEQLDWLSNLLLYTCTADSIDFVFAQLHHPHKSELWTPGESDYTGEVIERLEQFTSACGKPSIHFFGHTHAYSRGHSRDHKHLWINVATAGGAIDNWGEFPNFDYDEFAVSQDEYGFVAVEVTADEDPKVTVRRIARGDQSTSVINNTITDSMTIRRFPTPVNTPTPLFPVNEEVIPECVLLEASAFSSPHAEAQHGQSHWQVSTDPDNFSEPVAESWKNFENWYYEIDTQAGDNLSDEEILGLEENTAYWWRVRYRDRELNWSNWTAPVPFTTGASVALPNLLLNPGAEDSLANWIILEGVVEALTASVCSGVNPHSGDRYFVVGGLCDSSPFARCVQSVDVTAYADSIDTGIFPVTFGGYLSDYASSDLPEMRLLFLDGAGEKIDSSNFLSTLNNTWTYFSESLTVPAQTRTIQFELRGTRNVGSDNDSYFDDLFLNLGTLPVDCSRLTSLVNQALPAPVLKVFPNPVVSTALIVLPPGKYEQPSLHLVDISGRKINCTYQQEGNKLLFEKEGLAPGLYVFYVRSGTKVIGTGKLVIP